MKAWHIAVLVAGLLAGGSAAAKSPSVDDIYVAAKAGRMSEAEGMVQKVLAEHPNSGKAHYVAAQVYSKEGKKDLARKELATAERLAPKLSFAKPEAVSELKERLGVADSAQASPAAAPAADSDKSSFPWGMLALAIVVAIVIAMLVQRRRERQAQQAASYQTLLARRNGMAPGEPYPAGGYGAGYAPAAQPSTGSGILGSLATGAAVGAGLVAGEALAHHFLDGDKHEQGAQANAAPLPTDPAPDANYDLGGTDFGISDSGSWDDSTSVADTSSDFGSSDSGGDWT